MNFASEGENVAEGVVGDFCRKKAFKGRFRSYTSLQQNSRAFLKRVSLLSLRVQRGQKTPLAGLGVRNPKS